MGLLRASDLASTPNVKLFADSDGVNWYMWASATGLPPGWSARGIQALAGSVVDGNSFFVEGLGGCGAGK